MNKYNLLLVAIFLFFFSFNLVSAQEESDVIDTFKLGQNVDLIHYVRIDGFIAPNALCNLTVLYPNKTILVDFQRMTNNYDYFNYTIQNSLIDTKGYYDYSVLCINGTTQAKTQDFRFLVNLGGITPSQERSDSVGLSIGIFFLLGVISFMSLFFVRRTPIKITMFVLMIWFILITINMSFISLQDQVVNPSVENFMSFFLTISLLVNQYVLYALAIFWMITLFANLFNYRKKKREGLFEDE